MKLKVGDTIRLLIDTQGFRRSDMYNSINVPAGSFAVVTEPRDGHGWHRAAVLRYVKKHKSWKPTKVEINIIDDSDHGMPEPYHGEGSKWAYTDPLDKLALL